MFAINILKVPLCYQRPELFIASPISQAFRHIRIRTRLLIKRNYVFNYLHANRGHYDIKFGYYEGTRYSNLFVYIGMSSNLLKSRLLINDLNLKELMFLIFSETEMML